MGDRHDSRRVPGAVRPYLSGLVLVVAVRAVDAVWTRVTGDRPPTRSATDASGAPVAPGHDGAPRTVRDRLTYALLLGAALRVAKRAGLREPRGPKGGDDANA
jgi:hypothetical protein